jgi:hypothetical protein
MQEADEQEYDGSVDVKEGRGIVGVEVGIGIGTWSALSLPLPFRQQGQCATHPRSRCR